MKNKLLKYYNEQYFRKYTDTDLFKLELNSTEYEVKLIKDISYNLLKDIDIETFYIVHDLFEHMFYKDEPFSNLSKLSKDINNERTKLLNKFLSIFGPILENDKTLGEVIRLLQYSRNSCLVGGAVRDCILDKQPKDFDFCTDIDIETLERLFSKSGFKVQSEGKQFFVLIVSKNGQQYEIANFRKDKDNTGGEIGTIEEDSLRRDFGIGTGYIRLEHGNLELLDPSGQFVDDMNDMTIKFVGNAKDRLTEDPNRAFRFYRFVARGFNADKKSLKAVRENFNMCKTETSAERIRMEIEKMAGI